MEYLNDLGKKAKVAASKLAVLSSEDKNKVLLACAKALIDNETEIIRDNEVDIANAKKAGISEAMIDRLKVNHDRILGMAEGIKQVVELNDPIGEIIEEWDRPNGLELSKVRVPIGVIGIIYESRPNVTADAFALCFKTGNAVILRGGSDAINSNKAIVRILRAAIKDAGYVEDSLLLIEDTSRETATQFMKLNEYVDLLIPRGGAGLIKSVVNNATIPCIETGTGNCHVYVDSAADIDMAVNIIINAKTQRLGVCNACESLVVHKDIAKEAIPVIFAALQDKNVEIRTDEKVIDITGDYKNLRIATEEDYATEYLAAIISVKIVSSLEEAIEHINNNTTHHSEAIVTSDMEAAEKFLNEVDAAAVYVNASTRFTDGFKFGFGAEIGISTQKLHARGPMGLIALTSYKYKIRGNGQIRS